MNLNLYLIKIVNIHSGNVTLQVVSAENIKTAFHIWKYNFGANFEFGNLQPGNNALYYMFQETDFYIAPTGKYPISDPIELLLV